MSISESVLNQLVQSGQISEAQADVMKKYGNMADVDIAFKAALSGKFDPQKFASLSKIDGLTDALHKINTLTPEKRLAIQEKFSEAKSQAAGNRASQLGQSGLKQGEVELSTWSSMAQELLRQSGNVEAARILKENENKLNILSSISSGAGTLGWFGMVIQGVSLVFDVPELMEKGKKLVDMAIGASQTLPGIGPSQAMAIPDALARFALTKPNAVGIYQNAPVAEVVESIDASGTNSARALGDQGRAATDEIHKDASSVLGGNSSKATAAPKDVSIGGKNFKKETPSAQPAQTEKPAQNSGVKIGNKTFSSTKKEDHALAEQTRQQFAHASNDMNYKIGSGGGRTIDPSTQYLALADGETRQQKNDKPAVNTIIINERPEPRMA